VHIHIGAVLGYLLEGVSGVEPTAPQISRACTSLRRVTALGLKGPAAAARQIELNKIAKKLATQTTHMEVTQDGKFVCYLSYAE